MPDLSLLVPLEDARGDAVGHLRTWTHEQSLDRERYQIVLAATGDDPDGEAEIEAMLAPGDILTRVPGANLQELWNAAAERADADWLMLTEHHCEGDPACLAEVVRGIEREPTRDAFTLDHGHITATATGELNARWFDEIYEEWTAPGEWTRLNLVGFAIRRPVYQAAGGLHPDYGLFSGALLGARLDAAGARIGHIEGAHVLHVHPDDISEHHGHSIDFAHGECEARLREDPFFCDRYFGPATEWRNRMLFHPPLARRVALDIAQSAGRALAGRRSELGWLARELTVAGVAAAAGPRLALLRARALFALSERAASKLPLSPEARWRAFLRAQDEVVRMATLESVAEHDAPLPESEGWEGERPVQELGDNTLAGVHGVERQGERWFRWTHPAAVLRARLPRDGELRIDTGGVRGTPLSYVRSVTVNGRRVEPSRLRDEDGTLVAPLPSGGGPATVVVLCRPLVPGQSGSDDPRRLGIPIFSVGLEPACASS